MKKLIVTTAFILSGITLVLANAGNALNFSGSQHFAKEFPNATKVTYKTVDQYIAVNFVSNETKMEVFYNNEGEMVAKSKNISISDLPSRAATTINDKYGDWTATEVVEFENINDESTSYYAALIKDSKKIILSVDKNGYISHFSK